MRPPTLPTPPSGTTIARYGTYAEAQRAVDFLSDNAFPVQYVTIVGTDLRMVERVTGRLSYGRVALGGAASGAYFGLFVGLLLLFFAGGADFSLFFAVLIGMGFGMLFGVTSFAFTRGRRDFTSASQIVASEYQVLCHERYARDAMEVLGRLTGMGSLRGLGTPPPPAFSPGPVSGQPDPYGPPPGSRPSSAAPSGSPATSAGQAAPTPVPAESPAVQPPPVPEGLTYGEVMEQRRRERQERERAEAERARTQQPQDGPTEPGPTEHGSTEPGPTEPGSGGRGSQQGA